MSAKILDSRMGIVLMPYLGHPLQVSLGTTENSLTGWLVSWPRFGTFAASREGGLESSPRQRFSVGNRD